MSASMRWIAAGAVLLGGAGLMWQGRGLWDWATGAPTGDQLLIVATAMGDVPRARRAIGEGASLDVRCSTGCTPLALAAGRGDRRLVSYLLAEGADVNACFEDPAMTPLLVATVATCDAATIRMLLEAGADPNGSDCAKYRPLVSAASKGCADAVEVLLNFGADPNLCGTGPNNFTPLQAAAASGNDDVVALLRRCGAVH